MAAGRLRPTRAARRLRCRCSGRRTRTETLRANFGGWAAPVTSESGPLVRIRVTQSRTTPSTRWEGRAQMRPASRRLQDGGGDCPVEAILFIALILSSPTSLLSFYLALTFSAPETEPRSIIIGERFMIGRSALRSYGRSSGKLDGARCRHCRVQASGSPIRRRLPL